MLRALRFSRNIARGMDGHEKTTQSTMSRRHFLRAGAALAAAGLLAACARPRVPAGGGLLAVADAPATVTGNADRAAAAFGAQQDHLYSPHVVPNDNTSLYLEMAPRGLGNHYAFLWPFSQGMAAAFDMMALAPGDQQYSTLAAALVEKALPAYWDGTAYRSAVVPPLGLGGDRYYDDNAWIGLDLVRYYRMTGNEGALRSAQRIFRYLISGWDVDPTHPSPGGIFWVEAGWSRDRSTASNAPTAQLALRLYRATGDAWYLIWAERICQWMDRALLAENGLYYDRIDGMGQIDPGQSSANQGTMCGVNVLWYQISRDPAYLARAKLIARASLELYGLLGFSAQKPFNAIFLRNLLYLSTEDTGYLWATRSGLQQYADHAWQHNRAATNLFAFPANARTTQLIDQAAMVQTFACLACEPSRYDLLV